MHTVPSQCDAILAWMQEGKSITGLEALTRFGCIRLASRINELSRRGVVVKKERITTDTGKHIMRYSLPGQGENR